MAPRSTRAPNPQFSRVSPVPVLTFSRAPSSHAEFPLILLRANIARSNRSNIIRLNIALKPQCHFSFKYCARKSRAPKNAQAGKNPEGVVAGRKQGLRPLLPANLRALLFQETAISGTRGRAVLFPKYFRLLLIFSCAPETDFSVCPENVYAPSIPISARPPKTRADVLARPTNL